MFRVLQAAYHKLLIKEASLKRYHKRTKLAVDLSKCQNVLNLKPLLDRQCEASWAIRAGGHVTQLGFKRFEELRKDIDPQELQLLKSTYAVTPDFTPQAGWAEFGNRLAAGICLLGVLLADFTIAFYSTKAFFETNIAVSLILLSTFGFFTWLGMKPSYDLLLKPFLLRKKYASRLNAAEHVKLA